VPRPSTIESHQKRSEIDSELIQKVMGSGRSLRDIAGQFDVSKSALERYANGPFIEQMTRWRDAHDWAMSNNLKAELQAEKQDIQRLKVKAEKSKDIRTALSACDKAIKALELEAKVEQLISSTTTINITLHPEWIRQCRMVWDMLEPIPEAQELLRERLALEGADGPLE
jgi:hypothetical protein